MSEPVFLRHARGLTLAEIAALTGAAPPPEPLLARRIVDIASLDRAAPNAISFFDNRAYAAAAAATHAGACLTTAALAKELPARVTALVVREPYHAFVAVARELFPHALRPSSLADAGSIAGAHVHPSARLESGVTVEPGAVIGPRAEIGGGTVIGATAVIGTEVRIGRDCAIGAGAVISNALIGDRVIIHAGCKIGQDGFGFRHERRRPHQDAAGRPRHHPGRRRDRRRHHDRPRRHPRHRDRRGHQDRQPGPGRPQCHRSAGIAFWWRRSGFRAA